MEINVRIPKGREDAFLSEMLSRVMPPWSFSKFDTHGRNPERGRHYFHRDRSEDQVPCMVCLFERAVGHLVSGQVIPDTGFEMANEVGEETLREFDGKFVGPSAEAVGGISSMDCDTSRLVDHFSNDAIKRLEWYCISGEDTRKWFAFLIQVHKDGSRVHCDVFRRCLQASGWNPPLPIDKLASQYDFGLGLLAQFDESKK